MVRIKEDRYKTCFMCGSRKPKFYSQIHKQYFCSKKCEGAYKEQFGFNLAQYMNPPVEEDS